MLESTLLSISNTIAMLAIVMIISGILKDSGAASSVYSILSKRIKSKRILIALVSLLFGIIPIPGRICVACSILDSLKDNNANNSQMGVVAHLSTHHYYLWSPIEKSVIIVCGILGISYLQFISMMWIPAVLMILFSLYYIFRFIKEEDIVLEECSEIRYKDVWSIVGLFAVISTAFFIPSYTWFLLGVYAASLMLCYKVGSLKWFDLEVIALASLAVTLGSFIGGYQSLYMDKIQPIINTTNIITVAGVAFIGALMMGSSSKYAAICGMITKIIGIKYLPLIYLVEFCGYLMSPSHSCVVIAKTYFKTPIRAFVKPILWLSLILIPYGIFVAFY